MGYLEQLANIISKVRDKRSAEANSRHIRDINSRLSGVTRQILQIADQAKADGQTLVSPRDAARAREAMNKLMAAVDRLGRVRNMPSGFLMDAQSGMMDVTHALEIGPDTARTANDSGQSPKRGARPKSLTIMVNGVSIDDGRALRLLIGDLLEQGMTSSGKQSSGRYVAIIRPTKDVEALAAKIDFGEVIAFDVAGGRLTLKPDMSKMELYAPGVADNPSHPLFFQRNFLDLSSKKRQDDALEYLAGADPKTVQSKELRKQIARAIRDLAFETQLHFKNRENAIRGLATWGGRYSVPLLIQLLDEESSVVREATFAELAGLKDRRAIDPAARLFMADFRCRDEAAACLKVFGAEAEDAVLQQPWMDDWSLAKSTAELLGEIGTVKSLGPLRALREKPRFSLMEEEVNRAVAAIRARTKQ